MPLPCAKAPSGGKGNQGRFFERSPRICAAGILSSQPNEDVADCLKHYFLQEHADALIRDAIIPPPEPSPLPPLRKPLPMDMRHASHGQMAQLINPPIKTKFEMLANEFLETSYASYWKKPLGKIEDPVPMLPEGMDLYEPTFGKKNPDEGRLYDIVLPKNPLPDKTPRSKYPGVQTDRHYCRPPFDVNLTYGCRSDVDKRGRLAKCCVTDDKVVLGTDDLAIITSRQADYQIATAPRVGVALAPNENIKSVPAGFAFGIPSSEENLQECLITCEINPGSAFFRKCLGHLNKLRKCLSKLFLPTFFHKLYLELKYFDKDKSGWLPKEIVYDHCATKLIRFKSSLLEPLMATWKAFNGVCIDYKTFCHVINYREPSLELPKVEDVEAKCLHFSTTYREMIKPQPPDTSLMAGLPSGRYFDKEYPVKPLRKCKADVINLTDESDMKSCINPSIMTLAFVSHRDMYAVREPHLVKSVFEASGEKFENNKFDQVWKEAQKYHSQGLVCFETFRKALNEYKK